MVHYRIPRNFLVSIHIQIMNQDNLQNQETQLTLVIIASLLNKSLLSAT